jgi:hypothetical protein
MDRKNSTMAMPAIYPWGVLSEPALYYRLNAISRRMRLYRLNSFWIFMVLHIVPLHIKTWTRLEHCQGWRRGRILCSHLQAYAPLGLDVLYVAKRRFGRLEQRHSRLPQYKRVLAQFGAYIQGISALNYQLNLT